MNLRSLRFPAVIMFALSLAAAAPMQQHVFAQNDGQGMEMMVVTEDGSNIIKVEGNMKKSLPTDVVFTITSPDGLNVVDVAQVTPEDGKFMTEFVINPSWSDDGYYTITASAGVNSDTSLYRVALPVKVVGGLTEGDSMATDGNLEKAFFEPADTGTGIVPGITISATGEIGSDRIVVTGMTDRTVQDVVLTVMSPDGNIVTVGQISPGLDGSYEEVIITGGPLWDDNGVYVVTAQQNHDSLYTASAEVEIEDGLIVPEFGVIAAMILAVAIVSVIVASSRSGLSFVVAR